MKKNVFFIVMLAGMLSFAFSAEKGLILNVPSALAGDSKDSKDSKDKDSKDSEDKDSSNTTTPAGPWMCKALATVQKNLETKKKMETAAADKETEAKDSKDEADEQKAKDEDDDSVSESKKEDDDKDAKEKDDEYEKAKKEHDDAKSEVDDAEKELKAANTAANTSPCTAASGQPGYWSNPTGTPKPVTISTTTPISLREMHGK